MYSNFVKILDGTSRLGTFLIFFRVNSPQLAAEFWVQGLPRGSYH